MDTATKYHVLVTGSSSGFGKRMVKTLAQAGHRVFASMRNVNGRNENVATELQDWAKVEALALEVVELDITDQSSIDKAIGTILDTAGHLDVVVNNAGVGSLGIVEAFTIEQLHNIFDILTFGPIRVDKAILPHMRARQSGLLIHVTSVGARIVGSLLGTYSGAKAALEMMSDHLHAELTEFGVESIIVEPGGYPTERVIPNLIYPSDADILAQYGKLGSKAIEDWCNSAKTFLTDPQAPDPQEVGNAVKNLLDMPVGQRPIRTVVGKYMTQGVEKLNRASEVAQQEYNEAETR
ncbi:MAG: short-chain dehydrogenase/reductase [Candidatus Parabeggiatoa sp. nov. 3]|nr:MAG: short-chain dehydrogenase/reductase [Gammaproteobacteria bacterium]RKZ67633.1 MAG: short-chain dehydrogenase/reductase [Gammaproteobacteria bacterium]RKZ88647.1 MAG: short-chain dehydrogenase/reductase [Gammaproteobacteria bacterium]